MNTPLERIIDKRPLIEQVRGINDQMDIREYQRIRESVLWVNAVDPRNKELLELARQKGLI